VVGDILGTKPRL